MIYQVEFTDTFGGEANYCWAKRYLVKAKSQSGAIRAAKKEFFTNPGKATHKIDMDSGDMRRYKFNNMNICAFVTWADEFSEGEPLNFEPEKELEQ